MMRIAISGALVVTLALTQSFAASLTDLTGPIGGGGPGFGLTGGVGAYGSGPSPTCAGVIDLTVGCALPMLRGF